MPKENQDTLDEIDHALLRILAENPRAPYSDIADQLNEEGYKMTSEGIRYRVKNLYESTSLVLMTRPKEHGWDNLRLNISTANQANAKDTVFEELTEMPFWIVCRGIGSYDLYANATVPSSNMVDELVSNVRELDGVDEVQFYLETGRKTNFDNYLSL